MRRAPFFPASPGSAAFALAGLPGLPGQRSSMISASKKLFSRTKRISNDPSFAALAVSIGASFKGPARFDDSVCYGNFSLHNVTMAGAASFNGAEWLGGFWCDAARLPDTAEFAAARRSMAAYG